MTFSKAIYLSFGIHVLLFGAALAFAQFAGHLFGEKSRFITVSLVELGNGRGGGEGKPGPHLRKHETTTLPPLTRSLANKAPETIPQADNGPAHDQEAVQVTENPGGRGGAETGPESGTGDRMGMLAPEDWKRIQKAVENAKTYPRLARERGIEGTVLVRFRVLPTGNIEKVDIVKSSGSDILDTASIRTVYRAAPMPFVNGWVEVPMSYVLK